ncbi:MAG: ribonuclease III [Bacteroidales bacterium]
MKIIPFIRNYFSREREFYLILKQVLQYRPKELGLFKLALTHKSAAKKVYNNYLSNNERLEYLGDSVLNTVIADLLYEHYPNKGEGFLSKMRSKIVSRENLNTIAQKIGLQKILFESINDSSAINIQGNAFEAIIGAIYLDSGYCKTKSYIIKKIVNPYVDFNVYENLIFDYKSHIIEWGQKNGMEVVFEDIEKDMKKINQPIFVSKVRLFDKILGSGIGYSKKEAQQEAAKQVFDVYVE